MERQLVPTTRRKPEYIFRRGQFISAIEAELGRRKLTKVKAADEIGISPTMLSRITDPIKPIEPSLTALAKICAWLNYDVGFFFLLKGATVKEEWVTLYHTLHRLGLSKRRIEIITDVLHEFMPEEEND